jgi:hypothetical protein
MSVMELHRQLEELSTLGYIWPEAASVCQVCGEVNPALLRAWRSCVRSAYSPALLKAGWALAGRTLRISDMAYLQEQIGPLTARLAEAPRLAALFMPFVKVGVPVPDDLGVLRDSLIRRGLTAAGWRWLCHQPRTAVRKWLALGWTPELLEWLNLCSVALPGKVLHSGWLEAGRPYALSRAAQLVVGWEPEAKAQAQLQLSRYLRLLPAVPDPELLMVHEGIAAELCVKFQGLDLTLLQPKQTWSGLGAKVRRQQRARREHARAQAQAREAATHSLFEGATWTPRLSVEEFNGVQIRELVSRAALVQEGLEMTHCVGNEGYYTQGCIAGLWSIFSLRYPPLGLSATLQVVRYDRGTGWRIGQLSGPGNALPPQLFWETAQHIKQLLGA